MELKTAVAGAVAAAAVGWSSASVYAEMQKQEQAAAQGTAGETRVEVEPAPAFLGVAVAETPAPEGVALRAPALVVGQIHPGSPAETAGLQTGDVLLQLDDQRLVHPQQLSRLVAAYAPGQRVTLKVWRDGETSDHPVDLVERPAELQMRAGRLMPPPGPWQPHVGPGVDLFEHFEPMPGDAAPRWQGIDPQQLQQQLDQMQQDMQRQMQQLRQQMDQRGDEAGEAPAAELRMPGTQQSLQVIQTPDHHVTIRRDEHGQHLRATDAQGQVIFDGPVDTAQQRQSVPAEIRELIPGNVPDRDPAPAGRAV